ncbi:hypothetical protein [Tepidimonas sp.]|uniref:hypothetical protein n=1 Tax=Tepidimonas sp. TaxID=2002775 RepID=UPI002FDF714D
MHPTPALVTAAAARRLPRWVPWLLVAAFVLPGFVGRDPWRPDDLTAFAVMLDMRSGGPLLAPQVLGEAAGALAWLPYWLGAGAMALLPGLSAEWAARLPFIALLGLALAGTWYATYRLARDPAAQPVDLAFGERVAASDYARALADGALLALVATLGLAMRSHEATAATAQLAFATVLFHTVARGLSGPSRRGPLLLSWWTAAWGLSLSGAPWLGAALGGAALLWWWPRQPRRLCVWAGLGTLSALGAALTLAMHAGRWPQLWDVELRSWLTVDAWHRLARLLAWFVWPSAALALWALWRWRARWRAPHIGWPLSCVALILVATILEGGDDRTLLLALPPLATLAAFALPTLRRGMAAAMDWFALVFFTGAAVVIWVIWVAMHTGVPAKPAANVARLVPGFEPTFELRLFAPALLASLAWLAIVVWRLSRHTPALWKGLVLSASGLTLNWLLLMTLWLPLLNYGMGQAPISRRVAALVPPGACVAVAGLDAARIAGLQHHGGLTVRRATPAAIPPCPVLVVAPAAYAQLAPVLNGHAWRLRTEVPRLRENRERWLVFERGNVPRADH